MGTPSKSKDIGKWFEAKVQDALSEAKTLKLCNPVRLYDTHAAGNFLPQTPGDFIVATKHGAWLLECKASAKYLSLRNCLADRVEAHQGAELRLWAMFQPSYVMFYSDIDESVELWDGAMVGYARAEGKRLIKDGALAHIPWAHFQRWLIMFLTGGSLNVDF